MLIPPSLLSPAALRAIVEEFVTRDGTDHSPVEQRIEKVLWQLDAGLVELHFDDATQTCNIVPVEGKPAEYIRGSPSNWPGRPTSTLTMPRDPREEDLQVCQRPSRCAGGGHPSADDFFSICWRPVPRLIGAISRACGRGDAESGQQAANLCPRRFRRRGERTRHGPRHRRALDRRPSLLRLDTHGQGAAVLEAAVKAWGWRFQLPHNRELPLTYEECFRSSAVMPSMDGAAGQRAYA